MNPLVTLLTLAASLMVGFGAGTLETRPLDLLALVPLVITLLFPWHTLRYSLIPLGQIRAAHLTACLVDVGFGNDGPGGAAMVAAMALLHKTNATEEDLRWVEEQLAKAAPLRAAGLVAAALLRLHAGDRDGARLLLRSVELLRFPGSPPLAFRVAREWLAAEAATRGDWQAVLEHASRDRSIFTSRGTIFLGAAARRLLGREDAPSDEQLWALWLLAPARTRTRPLLRRALAARPVSPPARREEASNEVVSSDPLAAVLILQIQSWRDPDPTLEDLVRLGKAWDHALENKALERRLLVRSMDLGTHEGSKAIERLREVAAAQIAARAREKRLALGSVEAPGATVERAVKLLRDGMLAELEASCEALRYRAMEKRALPATDEWCEWLALRGLYEETGTIGGMGVRRLAWTRVRDDVCKLAVWLWNERGERTIAHAMFLWLLDEAMALHDTDAMELHRKNVACGWE
ncbi:MAG: hypothetical protein RMJ98_22575 [Myxococcales bacterium]|nr:hypothetical protein [Polyangiaceae bacterium]MDW8252090.1 hypothetical protein [Myxococcales bacterium]